MHLGKAVKSFRQDQSLSQQELADMAEVSRRFIIDIENGSCTNPSIKRVVSIATALGYKPWELIKESLIE